MASLSNCPCEKCGEDTLHVGLRCNRCGHTREMPKVRDLLPQDKKRIASSRKAAATAQRRNKVVENLLARRYGS